MESYYWDCMYNYYNAVYIEHILKDIMTRLLGAVSRTGNWWHNVKAVQRKRKSMSLQFEYWALPQFCTISSKTILMELVKVETKWISWSFPISKVCDVQFSRVGWCEKLILCCIQVCCLHSYFPVIR